MPSGEKKTRLRVFRFNRNSPIPEFKKAIPLPIYLYLMDDFAMIIARNCGCHNFHIEYEDEEGVKRRLADILLKKRGQKDIEYAVPLEEDRLRLNMFLERNKKHKHLMKETTKTS